MRPILRSSRAPTHSFFKRSLLKQSQPIRHTFLRSKSSLPSPPVKYQTPPLPGASFPPCFLKRKSEWVSRFDHPIKDMLSLSKYLYAFPKTTLNLLHQHSERTVGKDLDMAQQMGTEQVLITTILSYPDLPTTPLDALVFLSGKRHGTRHCSIPNTISRNVESNVLWGVFRHRRISPQRTRDTSPTIYSPTYHSLENRKIPKRSNKTSRRHCFRIRFWPKKPTSLVLRMWRFYVGCYVTEHVSNPTVLKTLDSAPHSTLGRIGIRLCVGLRLGQWRIIDRVQFLCMKGIPAVYKFAQWWNVHVYRGLWVVDCREWLEKESSPARGVETHRPCRRSWMGLWASGRGDDCWAAAGFYDCRGL